MLQKFLKDTRNRLLLNKLIKSYRNYFFLFILIMPLFLGVCLNLFSYDKDKAKKLFIEHCSKCHRKDGRGIKGVYPPLKNSDYVQKGDKIELLRGMLFGRSGRIIVNGEIYYGVMTTEIDSTLKNDEVSLILEFVYRELNNMDIAVTSDDVLKARKLGKLQPHN